MTDESNRTTKRAARTIGLVLLVLVVGLLAFALWPQEFRFERATDAGPERVAVYTRWGCIVKEVQLDAGGTPVRKRQFPPGRVPMWRVGSLPEIPGEWEEGDGPAAR